MKESADPSSPQTGKTGEAGDLPKKVSKVIRGWTRVVYALGGLAAAVFVVWSTVWPHIRPHHWELTVTCRLSQRQVSRGETVQLTYTLNSNEAASVGLGAGIYDNQGTDHSEGFGDLPDFALSAGRSLKSRPVLIPARLPAGQYEVTGEIWPANQIGARGVNTYADPTCAYFTVP